MVPDDVEMKCTFVILLLALLRSHHRPTMLADRDAFFLPRLLSMEWNGYRKTTSFQC
jgi:hypothetical protein